MGSGKKKKPKNGRANKARGNPQSSPVVSARRKDAASSGPDSSGVVTKRKGVQSAPIPVSVP